MPSGTCTSLPDCGSTKQLSTEPYCTATRAVACRKPGFTSTATVSPFSSRSV